MEKEESWKIGTLRLGVLEKTEVKREKDESPSAAIRTAKKIRDILEWIMDNL